MENQINYQSPDLYTTNNFAGGVAVELLGQIKALKQIADKAKDFAANIGIGGVTQDRFLARRDKVAELFKNNGYYTGLQGRKTAETMAKYKIIAADIPNRKGASYSTEYQRLRRWIIGVLNEGNPGLGNVYSEYFTSFPMANGGSMVNEPIIALEKFVTTFPPGTYKAGMIPPPAANPVEINTTGVLPTPVPPDPKLPPPTPGQTLAGFGLSLDSPVFYIVIIGILILVFSKLKN